MGYPAPASSRAPQLLAVCVAVLAALAIYGKTDAPVATGRDNAATAALRASADLFKQTKRRGRPTGIVAEPLLQASAALLPAFDSYGPLLGRAARADLLGNVRKLRKAGAGPGVGDVGTIVVADPDFRDVDGPTMALFWLNRILQQIAATFEYLLATDDDLVRVATRAYLEVTAPYNLRHQRAIGRILLKIIPNRKALVRCYGQPDFAHLAPVLERWLAASKPTRDAIDAFYAARPAVTPPLRWKKNAKKLD